jgi:fructosamine-3-kinase
MTTERQQAAIAAFLRAGTGLRFDARHAEPVHGGSIHRCVRWPGERDAFVKLAGPESLETYESEAAGLDDLRAAQALRVPQVLAVGVAGEHALLALEWLDLSSDVARESAVQARLGERLAAQHRRTAPRFGWRRDNVIGSTPQPNDEDDDWVRFLRQRRLGYMLGVAASCGLPTRVRESGETLIDRCDLFFSDYRPRPSLLHGDLWGGNWSAVASTGEATIFDRSRHCVHAAVRRLRAGVPRRLRVCLAARCRRPGEKHAVQPVPRAEPLRAVRRRLWPAGRVDDRSIAR